MRLPSLPVLSLLPRCALSLSASAPASVAAVGCRWAHQTTPAAAAARVQTRDPAAAAGAQMRDLAAAAGVQPRDPAAAIGVQSWIQPHVDNKRKSKQRHAMQPHVSSAAARTNAASSAAAAASSPLAAAAASTHYAAASSAALSSWSTEEPLWTSHPTDRVLRGQLERFRHLRAAHAGSSAAAVPFEPVVAATPEGLRDLSARTLDSILRAPLSAAGLLAVVSPPPVRALRSPVPHDFLSPALLSVVVALDSANLSTLGDAAWNRAVHLLVHRYHPQCAAGVKNAAQVFLCSNNLLYTIAQRAGLSRLCYATLHTHYTAHGTRALTPAAALHVQGWSNRMTLLRPMSDNILSDTLESLVGLVTLERGTSAAVHFVECLLGSNLLREPHSVPLADVRSKNSGERPKQFRPNSMLPKPIRAATRPRAAAAAAADTTVDVPAIAATAASDEQTVCDK